MKKENLILLTDSYKFSHAFAYNKNVTKVYSYLESRGGKFPYTLFFGLQYYLKKFLEGKVITQNDIEDAHTFCKKHFGRNDVFNSDGWRNLLKKYDGKLPLHIKAVEEGSIVPTGNVLMTIENTDPEFYWLTNFVETLLMKVWYPTTVATQSREIRKRISDALEKTGTPETINFKCHDFGYRGVSSEEQAGLGSAAHLLSFMGTDTIAGITMLENYYNGDMSGFSIPATEHSIICSFGKENEIEAYRHFLNEYFEGTIACVSDTYNIYNACENIWGGILKEEVLKRNGTLVIRPDSGDYMEVVPKILDILWNKFGGTINDKGYKVLDSHVRVIQGDGMNLQSITELYSLLTRLKWSADNLAVGSGGGLLEEGLTRDTQKFAIKASAVQMYTGEWIGIQKTPITDSGKRSKMGRLKLIKDQNDEFKTVNENEEGTDLLRTVFLNGELYNKTDIETIREKCL